MPPLKVQYLTSRPELHVQNVIGHASWITEDPRYALQSPQGRAPCKRWTGAAVMVPTRLQTNGPRIQCKVPLTGTGITITRSLRIHESL